jgi:DHA1 family bicyclomycin/chloramphenicol resistance-like MFS transporter
MSHVVRRRPDARLILLLGALAACGPIATDMYLPSLPSIADGFSVSAGAAQRTLTSFMAGFSIGMLLYGPLSDTWGRRPVLLGGIALFTLASIGCFVAGSIDMLIFVRFLQALGAGAASVLARAIARDAHEPTDAAKVLSMVAIVTAVGPLLAPLIGGQILRFAGWRGVFVVLASFGALCAATAYLRVPETWPKERRKSAAVLASFASYGRILSDPVAWGHMLCGGMAFASMFSYITATPFVYIEYFHVSPQHYGLLFGLNVVGIMIGNFANTRLVGSVGSLRIIAAASFVSCIASLAVALVALTGWGGLWSIVAPVLRGRRSRHPVGQLHDRPDASLSAQRGRIGGRVRRDAARARRARERRDRALADGTPFAMGVTIGVRRAVFRRPLVRAALAWPAGEGRRLTPDAPRLRPP